MTNKSNETDNRSRLRKYQDRIKEYNGNDPDKDRGIVSEVILAILGILMIPVIVLWALVTTIVGFFE